MNTLSDTAQTKKRAHTPSGIGKDPDKTKKAANSKKRPTQKDPKEKQKRQTRQARKISLKIVPLGGLNEIGKNLTVFECGQDKFIVDCGLAFPEADMYGVDMVLPDFTYLENNADSLRGIIITHGHEDHIGAIPYLLKKINLPVYGTRLTIGLIEGKLKEHGILSSANLNIITPRDMIKFGCMSAEAILVNHSIPDAIGLAIHTPAGIVIHTGDFKVDYSPIEGGIIDLARFGELGKRGVLALLSDSTNAERPGYTPSERTVGDSFDLLFKSAGRRRIMVATFSSNIHRVQQIISSAKKYNRKVAISGRSMENTVAIAIEQGYLKVPDDILISAESIKSYPNDKIIIITTGSQGEPMSALSRMASNDHRTIQATAEDMVIISATPIPGNEKHVNRVINDLMRLGAKVVYEKMYDVHVSGHACQDELKMVIALTKPRYFIPVHGEYKHIKSHAELAIDMGIAPSNVHIAEIGQVIELDNVDMRVTGTVPAGRIFVDGLGVGDVGSIVLRDRRALSQEGLIIVVATIEKESGTVLAGPDIISRGFVYVRESEELMGEARNVITTILSNNLTESFYDWTSIKSAVRNELSSFIYRKTKRSPIILPILMEV
ncbi:MAG: ribonuclease J [Oscillospiraceae bacterium]|nr:ribonuclease J [Oscillospiraceae bacterium]